MTLADLRVDPEPVEGVAHEDGASHHTGEADVTARLQPDLLERCRQVVTDVAGAQLAERLGPGHRDLPGPAKTQHGVAKLARVGEADRTLSDVRDEPDDVPSRCAQASASSSTRRTGTGRARTTRSGVTGGVSTIPRDRSSSSSSGSAG